MTGYRRYLLFALYALLLVGVLLLFVGSRPLGTLLVVATVLGVVGLSVTGREEE
jgi:hypothetical protein